MQPSYITNLVGDTIVVEFELNKHVAICVRQALHLQHFDGEPILKPVSAPVMRRLNVMIDSYLLTHLLAQTVHLRQRRSLPRRRNAVALRSIGEHVIALGP